MIHLDTHVVLWLHEGLLARVPATVQARVDTETVSISPMVQLELAYLFEIGRVRPPPSEILRDLASTIDLEISTTPFGSVVKAAADLTWTRDPFDRLICGQAIADDATVMTADRRIRDHFSQAAWD